MFSSASRVRKAWWLVTPVLLLVAFNAFIPLMTVVNYAFQETFGNNQFFWEGTTWFEKVLRSERFHDALGRQLLFTSMILIIEVPLGIAVALSMPRKGPWVSVCLVLMALPLLIPWNVVGAMWNIFTLGFPVHSTLSWMSWGIGGCPAVSSMPSTTKSARICRS